LSCALAAPGGLVLLSKTIVPIVDLSESILGASLGTLLADAVANPTLSLRGVFSLLYNESTWDRRRGNTREELRASTVDTTTWVTSGFINYNSVGIQIGIDITAVSGTSPTYAQQVRYGDGTASTLVTVILATSGNYSTTGGNVFLMYPGNIGGTLGGGAKGSTVEGVGFQLPRIWSLRGLLGGTSPSFTSGIDAQYGN